MYVSSVQDRKYSLNIDLILHNDNLSPVTGIFLFIITDVCIDSDGRISRYSSKFKCSL